LVSHEEGSTPVTPGLIAAYIQEVSDQDWVSDVNEPICLKTNRNGRLEKVTS